MKAIAITAFFFNYRRRSVYRKRQKSQSSGRGSTFGSSDRKKKIEPTPPPKPLTTSNLLPVSVDLPLRDALLCRWNNSIRGILCLAFLG